MRGLTICRDVLLVFFLSSMTVGAMTDRSVTVSVGNKVEFRCMSMFGLPFLWQHSTSKDSTVVYNGLKVRNDLADRVSVLYYEGRPGEQTTSVLIIENTQLTDAGVYGCIAFNSSLSSTFELAIKTSSPSPATAAVVRTTTSSPCSSCSPDTSQPTEPTYPTANNGQIRDLAQSNDNRPTSLWILILSLVGLLVVGVIVTAATAVIICARKADRNIQDLRDVISRFDWASQGSRSIADMSVMQLNGDDVQPYRVGRLDTLEPIAEHSRPAESAYAELAASPSTSSRPVDRRSQAPIEAVYADIDHTVQMASNSPFRISGIL